VKLRGRPAAPTKRRFKISREQHVRQFSSFLAPAHRELSIAAGAQAPSQAGALQCPRVRHGACAALSSLMLPRHEGVDSNYDHNPGNNPLIQIGFSHTRRPSLCPALTYPTVPEIGRLSPQCTAPSAGCPGAPDSLEGCGCRCPSRPGSARTRAAARAGFTLRCSSPAATAARLSILRTLVRGERRAPL
jgi:hypothetical protein